jgi:hypothetical protein
MIEAESLQAFLRRFHVAPGRQVFREGAFPGIEAFGSGRRSDDERIARQAFQRLAHKPFVVSLAIIGRRKEQFDARVISRPDQIRAAGATGAHADQRELEPGFSQRTGGQRRDGAFFAIRSVRFLPCPRDKRGAAYADETLFHEFTTLVLFHIFTLSRGHLDWTKGMGVFSR